MSKFEYPNIKFGLSLKFKFIEEKFMIEVLFGESEAAAMKISKEKGIIVGDSEKVICLALMLDIGDILDIIN